MNYRRQQIYVGILASELIVNNVYPKHTHVAEKEDESEAASTKVSKKITKPHGRLAYTVSMCHGRMLKSSEIDGRSLGNRTRKKER